MFDLIPGTDLMKMFMIDGQSCQLNVLPRHTVGIHDETDHRDLQAPLLSTSDSIYVDLSRPK